jgi:chorismate--pyruvate lyase
MDKGMVARLSPNIPALERQKRRCGVLPQSRHRQRLECRPMLPLTWIPASPRAAATRPMRQPGSLTARLAMNGRVSVDVRYSGWQSARPDEAAALGLARPGLRIYVREVVVRRNGQAAVLARSVTTVAGVRGPWKGLRKLGRRPLAALLWTDPRIQRGPFEFTRLPLGSRPPARRSCFWRHGQPLVVMEAFVGLPWPDVGWLSRRRRWLARR